MQLDMTLLQNPPLFKGIKTEELNLLFTCIGARQENYQKGEFIFFSDNTVNAIGIVLTLACGKYRFNDPDIGS